MHSDQPTARARGGALVTVLAVLSLGLITTAVLTLLSAAERHLAASDRDGVEARYAAESAFDRALADLLVTAEWADVLSGSVGSSFAIGPPLLATSTGPVDLDAERRRMQARTDAASAAGANTPRWRLFGWGSLSDVLPAVVESKSPVSIAVWVADDEAETDGLVERDSNQTLWVRAVAYGAGGTRRAIEGLVVREPATAGLPGPLRRLIWREAAEG